MDQRQVAPVDLPVARYLIENGAGRLVGVYMERSIEMVVGILATIALPAFLGEQDKGLDADAKAQAEFS